MSYSRSAPTSAFLADRPIERAADDRLDVDAFVRRLVAPILHAPDDGSLVLGLYGRWGTGKTSALYLLEAALDETARYEGADAKQTPHAQVIRFTPWLYASVETLLPAFFDTLAAGVGGLAEAPKKQRRRLEAALKGMSEFVVPATQLAGHLIGGPLGGAAAKLFAEAAKGAAKGGAEVLAATATDFDEGRFRRQRDEAAKLLRELRAGGRPIRVVMTVDDLDRSAGVDEVLAMLKLVKLVADLPNVVYVIAMDREHIEDLLSTHVSERFGREFLDKIVQVAVSLPPVDAKQLSQMLVEDATRIAQEAGLDTSTLAVEWDGLLADYLPTKSFERPLRAALRSPRDVSRILNAYRFAALTGEEAPPFHAADLLLLSTLQVVAPRTYDAVRVNGRFLLHEDRTFWDDAGRDRQGAEAARTKREARLAAIVTGAAGPPAGGTSASPPETAVAGTTATDSIPRDVIRDILVHLFPYAVAPKPDYRSGGLEGVRQQQVDRDAHRIRSPERFATYFRLSPPPDQAPVRLVRAAFSLLTSNGDDSVAADGRAAPVWVEAFDRLAASLAPDVCESLFVQISDRAAAMSRAEARVMAARLPELARHSTTDLHERIAVWAEEAIDTLTTYRAGGRGERETESGVAADAGLALGLLRALIGAFAHRDLRVAADYAERVTRESGYRAVYPTPEAQREIAALGLERARELFEQTPDVFDAFTSNGGVTAVWDYRHLATRAGAVAEGVPYRPLQVYLQGLVDRVPTRLSDLLAAVAGWGSEGASYSHRPLPEIRGGLGTLVDLGWLDAVVRHAADVAAQSEAASSAELPPVNWPNLIETYSNALNALAAEQVSEAEDDPDEAYAGIAGTVFSSGGSPATVGGGTSAAGDDAQAGDARPELDTSALPGQVDEQPNISASDEV